MYRPYQNRANRRGPQTALSQIMARKLAASRRRRKEYLPVALLIRYTTHSASQGLSLDHERSDGAHEILLGSPMLDKRDYFLRPRGRIIEAGVVAIGAQKQSHCCKGGALVSLLERVCLGNAGHQRNGQYDDVLFTIAEEISRACQCAF